MRYLSAPVERHQITRDADGVTLRLPALTALQLYYDGVLTNDNERAIQLTVAGRPIGAYYLHWMHTLPGRELGDPVLLRFGLVPTKRERPFNPGDWLTELVPLKLYPQGDWDPLEEYWGEPGEPIGDWATPIIKRGTRPMYEMEQVLPGVDPEDFDSDPIMKAVDLKDSGKIARAKKLLEGLLMKDMSGVPPKFRTSTKADYAAALSIDSN